MTYGHVAYKNHGLGTNATVAFATFEHAVKEAEQTQQRKLLAERQERLSLKGVSVLKKLCGYAGLPTSGSMSGLAERVRLATFQLEQERGLGSTNVAV